MAIERVKRLELVFPLARRDQVLAALHAAAAVHLEEPSEEALAAGSERASVTTEQLDAKVAALSTAVEAMNQHCPARKTLVESFFGVAPSAARQEVLAAAREVDAAALGREAGELRERWREAAKTESEARAELAVLESFRGLSFTGRDLEGLERSRAVFGLMSAEKYNALRLDPAARMLVHEEVRREGRRVWLLAAFRPADSEAAAAKLREHGFEELPFPKLSGSAEERAAELREALERVNGERDQVRARSARLAADRRRIELALAHWEDRRELAAAARFGAGMKRVGLLSGWVRERDLEKLEGVLARELPDCSARFSDPALEDEPPVSIKLPRLLKPMQLLVNMFGLPEYRSFDPTSYLALSYLVFFGCCFGDVVYGLALCGISFYVMRRYRHSWVKNFFQFFLYAGISSAVVGLLTGTWMGDLLTNKENLYLSAGNPLVRFAQSCALMDPLDKALLALLIALGLGVTNQFYGIVLKAGLAIRRRDYATAAFDAGLWLLFLPGMLIIIAPMFSPVPVPATLVAVGWWLLGISAVGLVLTQGRKEEGILGKAITGVVSLYGILGSYGATSFIGDVLSYSRLLALGLTTTIIGMSFNIIAGLFRDVPYAGPALFVLVLVVGHAFNFAVSILGAFVHPARLVLLEFFNRFYESGGRPFRPLAFGSERVEIVGGRGV